MGANNNTHSRKEKLLLLSICLLACTALVLGFLIFSSRTNPLIESSPSSSAKNQSVRAATASAQVTGAFIRSYIATHGSVAAWKYLVSLKNTSQGGSLHDAAHLVGSSLYADFGLESLSKCDISYAFGCYHGAIEEYITLKGVQSLPTVVSFCQKNYPKIAITCYHGIGHGLLTYYKYQLKPALTNCDKILDSKNASFCYKGVFMEFASEYTNKVSLKDPLWPCTTVDTVYKKSCYGYQMTYLTKLYKDDPTLIEMACRKAETPEFQDTCIQGYGHLIAQRYFEDPKDALHLCRKMSKVGFPLCINSVAEELVFQGKDSTSVDSLLCNELSGETKANCEKKTALQKSLR